MLDLFKLKISTKYMKGFIAKVISKKICKKFGCRVDINFRDIDIDTVDGDVVIHIDVDGKINKEEFEKLLKYND